MCDGAPQPAPHQARPIVTALIRRAGAGKVYPLIRKNGDGWEMLRIGSLAAGRPEWEPYPEWDHLAWEARQRQAEAIRRALILEQPAVLPATAVMELV